MDRLADSEDFRAARFVRSPIARGATLIAAALLLISCSGCQIVLGTMQIFQGFPKTRNDFYVKTHHRSLAEKGKRVIVLAAPTPSAQVEEPSLDLDIMAEVSRRLKVEKIDVVEPHKVARWIDDNGQIGPQTALEPIAEKFNADFIVLITFEDFGYREENSPGLYRGHANGKIVVTEIVEDRAKRGKKRAKVIYNNPFTTKYPANRPLAADQEGPDVFKRKFMGRLSESLTRTFVDYRPEEEIQ